MSNYSILIYLKAYFRDIKFLIVIVNLKEMYNSYFCVKSGASLVYHFSSNNSKNTN